MSTLRQNTPTLETVDARQPYLDTALRIATIVAEANARIFKLQTEAASVALAENSKHLKTLLETRNPAAAVTEWAGLYQSNVDRVLEVTRTCFEVVPQTQAELAKLVGEPIASYHKETQQYLDQFTRAIADGRDAAAAQMTDFLAKAVESVRAPQDANKENVA
jgi:phasin family protein